MKTGNLNSQKIIKYSFITMLTTVFFALASMSNFYSQNYNFKNKLESGGFLQSQMQIKSNNIIEKEETNA